MEYKSDNWYAKQMRIKDREQHGAVLYYFEFQIDGQVEVHTKSLRVNVNTFISNIGGGLGLFLGFSLISILDILHGFISDKLTRRQQRQRRRVASSAKTRASTHPK